MEKFENNLELSRIMGKLHQVKFQIDKNEKENERLHQEIEDHKDQLQIVC